MVHQKAAIADDFLSNFDFNVILKILEAKCNIVNDKEHALNQHKRMFC